jgi:hypothetical protein
VLFAPVIIGARPASVLAVALVGSAVAVIVGIGAAVARIVWTHGKPLGDRDPMLDAGSPYLRPGNRLRLLFAMGLIGFAIGGMTFEVSWYPRPHPFIPEVTPEDYTLPGLLLMPFMLALGVYLSVVELFWARVVRQARRASLNAIDTSQRDTDR